MMLRRILLSVLFLAGACAWLLIRGDAAPQASASDTAAATVLITFGEHAKSVEHWDGSIAVSGGELIGIEGRQFSQADTVTAPDSWKCTTRQDGVPPYADVHYMELAPGSTPEVRYHPVGVYATIRGAGDPRIAVKTAQGNFDFAQSEAAAEPKAFLGGRATVVRAPTVEKLNGPQFEDDEPAITALQGGRLAVAWVAYRDRADRVLLRTLENGAWSEAEEVTPKPATIFRTAAAADASGSLWVFWSQLDGDNWQIWARRKTGAGWQPATPITSAGSNTFLRAAAAANGSIFVAWQSYRGRQSDIYLKALQNGAWSDEVKVSESPANDWEPAIAAGPDGTAYIAWDTYDQGNYDICFRTWRQSSLSVLRRVTAGPQFQAHASVAVDNRGRAWVAWDESGVNWGKDQGFLIPTPLASPLHFRRNIHVALWGGNGWLEPRAQPAVASLDFLQENAEHPQIAFDGKGTLVMILRHWTRRNDRLIGSPITWENYVTRLSADTWSTPLPLAHSMGSIEKQAALAAGADGGIRAAWMTDNRPFATQVPGNADIYFANLGPAQPANLTAAALQPYVEALPEAIPIHPHEREAVAAARSYAIQEGGREFHLYRGDMHRHSDVSPDFKYDGSIIELYRYAMDVAAFDYLAVTDHQAGYDQEFTWWQNQKLADIFWAPDAFTPLYAYERSVVYPNGHRNVIFDHRGVRTLPIPADEMSGKIGSAALYEYLHKNDGITMPHSTATLQGTDFRDHDPEVEPLVEIYQGYRNSYEYECAPRSATRLNPPAQKSGFEPAGFWWNALAKGYKLGVQSSSDHWSTHISYAFLVAENATRKGLVDAIRKRHAYGATDNIILDFRASAEGAGYLMGDEIHTRTPPRFSVRVSGTGPIQQIDFIKSGKFIYATRPESNHASFEFTDRSFAPEKAWYYVRVLQQDGQLAWSSPIWIEP
jgi:hypothetical protein